MQVSVLREVAPELHRLAVLIPKVVREPLIRIFPRVELQSQLNAASLVNATSSTEVKDPPQEQSVLRNPAPGFKGVKILVAPKVKDVAAVGCRSKGRRDVLLATRRGSGPIDAMVHVVLM